MTTCRFEEEATFTVPTPCCNWLEMSSQPQRVETAVAVEVGFITEQSNIGRETMISDDRLQKAMTYLAETDEPAAKAKALVEGLKIQEKTIIALAFLKSEGTNQEREMQARVDNEHILWRAKYAEAVADYELYRNKRKTEELVVEVWRSINANRRRGNV